MTRYYLDHTGWGDLALWRDNGDTDPTEVETQHASSTSELAHERWQLLLRGAGLDPDTVCVSRTELLAVLDDVGGSMRTATGEVLRGSEEDETRPTDSPERTT